METINIDNTTAATVLLADAISLAFDKKIDVPMNPKGILRVELRVNGVEVPFEEAVQRFWETQESSLNERAAKYAMDTVNLTSLNKTFNEIQLAQEQLKDKLAEVFNVDRWQFDEH